MDKNDGIRTPHLSRMIIMLAHAHDMRIREQLESVGLPKAVGHVLFEISHSEGITQSALAQKMNFKPSSISVTLRKMCDAGLIRKEDNLDDARCDRLFLTEKGKECRDRIRRTFEELEAEFVSPLTEEERKTLYGLITKLSERNDIP